MSIRLPSASKVALALRCAFYLSPIAPRTPREAQSLASERGNAVHALAEAILEGRPHECSVEVEAYRAPLTEAIDALVAEGWMLAAELPMAYSPTLGEGRLLKKGSHRDYSDVGDDEIPGTSDIVGVMPGKLLVVDVKTGRVAKEHEPIETEQLRALAVGLASVFGADSVDVALLHVEPGDYAMPRGDLYAWDLENIAESLRALAAMENPSPVPGTYCTDTWCPIRAVCPATLAAIAAIDARAVEQFPAESIISGVVVESNGTTTRLTLADADVARKARVALKLYDDRAKMLREALHNFIRGEAIEVSPGVFYGFVENRRETVGDLTPEAVAIIREAVGEEALSYSSSGDAIEKAAKARQSKRGEGMRKAAEVKAQLRRLGVLKSSTFSKPQEFTKNDNEETAA